MSLKAYQQAVKVTEDSRGTEFRLFADVTRALMEAGPLPRSDRRVISAIDWNRQMWSTLALDCANGDNKLAQGLRAQIVSLSIWVAKYSSRVMREGAPVDPLIDINRTIMQGLAQRQTAQAQPSAATR